MSNYIVGDIHGSYDKLMRALENVGFSDSDNLFSVGDLCDRGFDNFKVIDFCKNLGDRFKPVFGNHDIWLYEYLKTNRVNKCWYNYNGGRSTQKEIEDRFHECRDKYLDWLGDFPYMRVEGNNVITHNFIRPNDITRRTGFKTEEEILGITLANSRLCGLLVDLDYDDYVYDRFYANILENYTTAMSEYFDEVDKDYLDKVSELLDDFSSDRFYIMGHTPRVEGITRYNNIINIDTGAFIDKGRYFTSADGYLTIMDLDTKEYCTSESNEKIQIIV